MIDSYLEPIQQRRLACQIRADVENAFQESLNGNLLRRVHCAAADGQAILWGTVANAETRLMAEHIAAHLDNVACVLNRIQVEESEG